MKRRISWSSWLRFPTEPKDVFPWLVKRLIVSAGLGNSVGIVLLVLAGVSLLGFLVGDYQGTGGGTVGANGSIRLGSATAAKNHALLSHDTEVADAWQQGLSATQIAQVQVEQAGLPAAVLLAIGKVENNLNPPDAHRYARFLQPHLVWHTFEDVTVRTWTTENKQGQVQVHTSVTRTPVTRLVSADLWDGTLVNRYRYVSHRTGQAHHSTLTERIVLVNTERTYTWSRVWALLKAYPAGLGSGHTEVLRKNRINRQTIAGLIAAVDDTISDPYVQAMVDGVDYPGGVQGLGTLSGIAPARVDVVQNVLRYRSYIERAAAECHLPAVLIAGVMAEESGGREHQGQGVLTSYAGAMGLMQVEPATAAGWVVHGVQVGNQAVAYLSQAGSNLLLGSLYLSELYHQFGENVEETLSAYNAGGGAEEEALAEGYTVAQNSQTENYVSVILGRWIPALQQSFGPL
ncbi:transglycosylase SLT domain-containing protein [Alicyclobacillus sp. SP_1]|uniref:transglycosylase SLT domain-containing protein n=1 Tax=Alicyclobacillus sp. SP_1 TaxID=2942475 RepID=UPI002157D196|nr:transglycosylase SLT domain-containing protein [Alicyclobacillus sp. SP_1]